MPNIFTRLKNAYNAFQSNKDPTIMFDDIGPSSYLRPDRTFVRINGNEKSIFNSVCNRFAVDASCATVSHVMLDEQQRYSGTVFDDLQDCLTIQANVDQTGRELLQDAIESMLLEGYVAIIPVETSANVRLTDSYKIYSLRVGKIVEWYPYNIKVELYDERSGHKSQIIWPKKAAAIIQNPFYSVMNAPNSLNARILNRMNLMDKIDSMSGADRLDLLIQLPYMLNSEHKIKQAEKRRKEIETQLRTSDYGIAYTDATEHVTQLNRPVESQVLKHTEYLTSMLFNQLGITTSILDGSATDQELVNYNNRIIEPILSAVVNSMKRSFLSKTARTQGHSIMFFSDPFRLIPVSKLADMADKFIRNQILSPNEFRQIVGRTPSPDPRADELRNPNINQSDAEINEEQNMSSIDDQQN